MVRNLIAALLFLGLATVVWADFEKGFAAYKRGDYATALKEFRKSAERGNASAQSNLGFMYSRGRGVAQDYAEAVKWYRKAADQGDADAQHNLGFMYHEGRGVTQDYAEAVKWYRKAAEQGHAAAQSNLGLMYSQGRGVTQDYAEAVKWYRKAAEQGDVIAQSNLGFMYHEGRGVTQDYTEAVKWFRKAADQGDADAQSTLGTMYGNGEGVPQDYVMSHLWSNLASAGLSGADRERAVKNRNLAASRMTTSQLAEAQRLAREWRPKQSITSTSPSPPPKTQAKRSAQTTGTGFIVSKTGHVLTNHHVVDGCKEVRTQIPASKVAVTPVVARDPRNDLALVKLSSPVASAATFRDGRTVRQGDSIVAVGFPLHGVLASGANLTTGTVSALAGLGDDTRFLQISAPVQPGNSGGPLLDLSGNVVGVVVSKLDAIKVAKAIGDIPQNVNFAISAAVARGFLDAKGVKYETAPSNKKLEAADVGELAKKFTVVVECWK